MAHADSSVVESLEERSKAPLVDFRILGNRAPGLQKIDEASPKPDAPAQAFADYNVARANLSEKLVALAKDDESRESLELFNIFKKERKQGVGVLKTTLYTLVKKHIQLLGFFSNYNT